MIKKLLGIINKQQDQAQHVSRYRELMRKEAEIGGKLFGEIPKGHRREFFCLDETTWIWHEEWLDKSGKRQIRTTRYDVRPSGVVKAQDGAGYQAVSKNEAKNLINAAQIYRERVFKEVYSTSA